MGSLPFHRRQGEAEPLLVVGDAGQAVLAPAVGARAGLIVGEVVPGVSVPTVILPHRAPLPLAQVGPHFFQGVLPPRASSKRVVSAFLAGMAPSEG